MRLANVEHTRQPWWIHELTHDFHLEDVWEVPGVTDDDDFPRLVQRIAAGDPSRNPSWMVRTLFAIRWKLGALIHLDDRESGVGTRVPTLRDRLPPVLRDGPTGPAFDALPFTSVYLTDDEWAAEISNRTMHGVLHLGWVPIGAHRHRAQMAVYVKPNGRLGAAYMAAIRPFRHRIVYPRIMQELGRVVTEAPQDSAAPERRI